MADHRPANPFADRPAQGFIARRLRQLIGRFLCESTPDNAEAVIRMLELFCGSPHPAEAGWDEADFQRLRRHWHRLAASTAEGEARESAQSIGLRPLDDGLQ